MTAAQDTPVLTVRGPADLINAVPYLIGFHPETSLVVVGLEQARVAVTIRMDLALARADPGSVETAISGMHRGGARQFVVMIFDDGAVDENHHELRDAFSLPWGGVVDDVSCAITQVDAELGDVLLVADGRFWSYLCFGADCCPVDGIPVAAESSEVPARATYAGLVALPDRESIERLLDPAPSRERARLTPAIERAVEAAVATLGLGAEAEATQNRRDVRALFAAARAAELTGFGDLPESTTAHFGAALRRVEVRDRVWTALDDGRLAGDVLWRHLAMVLPDPFSAPPLFLVGWSAWRRGNGALALIAAERALEADPGYGAADLLLAAISNAVDPRILPRIRRAGRKYGR